MWPHVHSGKASRALGKLRQMPTLSRNANHAKFDRATEFSTPVEYRTLRARSSADACRHMCGRMPFTIQQLMVTIHGYD
jgi:hypothetical protein